jgi:chorismate synthase
VALLIENRDFKNHTTDNAPFTDGSVGTVLQNRPSADNNVGTVLGNRPYEVQMQTVPRPGHADLPGAQKIGTSDYTDVSERASARETAIRVAAGAVAKAFLAELGVTISSNPHEASHEAIDAARAAGDTLGGTVTLTVTGLVPGLGGYAQADHKLDARLAQALIAIPSVKAIEFGDGFALADLSGSQAHDAITYGSEKRASPAKPAELTRTQQEIPLIDRVSSASSAGLARTTSDDNSGYTRTSNHAGGIEGGMSNGEALRIRLAVKPVPTLDAPLPSVDALTQKTVAAPSPRHDTSVVPAVGVIAEAEAALVLATAYTDKFSGDCLGDIQAALAAYQRRLA